MPKRKKPENKTEQTTIKKDKIRFCEHCGQLRPLRIIVLETIEHKTNKKVGQKSFIEEKFGLVDECQHCGDKKPLDPNKCYSL